MKLAELVATSGSVAETGGRLDKIDRLARLLERLDPEEAPAAVAYLSGELPQGKIGVGPATLDDVLPVEPTDEPGLELLEVDAALRRIGGIEGSGSQRRRAEALTALFGRATSVEQDFLARLLLGELRQGAQEGILLEAVAEAMDVAPARVRRAVMLRGRAGAVARALLDDGEEALDDFALRLFRPVKPMLARTAEGVDEALERLGRASLEYKLDGARLQVHRDGDAIRVFSRRLNEKTAALPEVVEAVSRLPARRLVLDGEALSLREDGSPRPFQETMRRFGREGDVASVREEIPLTPFFFDCLYLEGESLLDRPASERFERLGEVVPEAHRVPRIVTDDRNEAETFLDRALREGHEGLLAKALDARYEAGRRGHTWLKIKHVHTADLVVLAAEWGHGRRRGRLSNIHLGARAGGDFVMVGKTFKGMTDRMLDWQTDRFLELERERRGNTVYVEPRVVAEVAFDGVQESPTYASGLALRFARVRAYRDDKRPEEADTADFLRDIRDGRLGPSAGDAGSA